MSLSELWRHPSLTDNHSRAQYALSMVQYLSPEEKAYVLHKDFISVSKETDTLEDLLFVLSRIDVFELYSDLSLLATFANFLSSTDVLEVIQLVYRLSVYPKSKIMEILVQDTLSDADVLSVGFGIAKISEVKIPHQYPHILTGDTFLPTPLDGLVKQDDLEIFKDYLWKVGAKTLLEGHTDIDNIIYNISRGAAVFLLHNKSLYSSSLQVKEFLNLEDKRTSVEIMDTMLHVKMGSIQELNALYMYHLYNIIQKIFVDTDKSTLLETWNGVIDEHNLREFFTGEDTKTVYANIINNI